MKQELNLQKYLNPSRKPRMLPYQFMTSQGEQGRIALDIFEQAKKEEGFLVLITYPAYVELLSREAMINSIIQLFEYRYPGFTKDKISFYELYLSPSQGDPMGFHLVKSMGSIEPLPESFTAILPEDSPFDLSDWKDAYPNKFKPSVQKNREVL